MLFLTLFFCMVVGVWAQAGRTAGAGNLPPGTNTPQGTSGIPGQPPEPPPSADCSIAGRVLSVTGDPLNKGTLTLQQVFTGTQRGPGTPSFTTTTSGEGKFVMTDLPPGSYQLLAERNGFVTTSYGAKSGRRGGTPLTLMGGQSLTGLEFKLLPHAVITGRVVDSDGEPFVHAAVSALQYRYGQSGKLLVPVGGARTDDRGEYRIFGLQPGRYYISATDSPAQRLGVSEDRSPTQHVTLAYATTYFPGTTDVDAASPVDAATGRELQEVNLKLSSVRTVNVRGRVIDEVGAGKLMVFLRERRSVAAGRGSQAVPGPDGRFEVRGVMPGSYAVVAIVQGGEEGYSVQTQIEVGTSDLENVALSVRKGFALRGTVRLEAAPAENLSQLNVTLISAQSGMMLRRPPSGNIDPEGNFVLENVSADQYRVSVSGLPTGYYVKSIRLGREDALENALDLTAGGGGTLEIVLGRGVGQVEGSVSGADQQPFPGATVVLVPDSERRRKMAWFYKTATTDQTGRYTLSSIDPGGYRIYAFDDIEPGEWMDPDLINSLRSKGTDIRVEEGSSLTLDLKLIGR